MRAAITNSNVRVASALASHGDVMMTLTAMMSLTKLLTSVVSVVVFHFLYFFVVTSLLSWMNTSLLPDYLSTNWLSVSQFVDRSTP